MPTEENVSNIRLSILTANSISKAFLDFIYIYMMMMIMMVNCFVVWLTDKSLISSRDHCQRSSPSKSPTNHKQDLNLRRT